MTRRSSVFMCEIAFLLICILSALQVNASAQGVDSGQVQEEALHGLKLSNMQVRISSPGHVAIFRLYDTVAARQFFAQLPLKLELSNFRDAQWMFYPPERLSVKANEAYHDGKRGELSYYEPWGDVFMLYKDFYAGDEMHRLGVVVSGIDDIEPMSGIIEIEANTP